MKKLILGVALISSSLLSAQNEINDYMSLQDHLRTLDDQNSTSKKVAGSPYWEEDFLSAKILSEDKKALPVFLRYNILKDQMEIKVEKTAEDVFVLPRTKDYEYDLDEYDYFMRNYQTSEGDLLTGYIIKYYQGDNILFVGKPTAEVSAAQKAETSYDRAQPAKINVRSHYYLGIGEQPLIEVRLKEKDFRKILGDSARMKEYFKENKVRDLEDIVAMLKFYDNQ